MRSILRRSGRILPAYVGSALALLVSGESAHADTWGVFRHDPARTGESTGAVPLTAPNVRWRAFLGAEGDGRTTQLGLGQPSIAVSAIKGSFIARDAVTQSTLWQSEVLGTGVVDAIADLDGDTKPEVVVHNAAQAFVLDGGTGQVTWSSPPDRIEIMGGVRVRDVDGDGLPDLYLDNGIGAKYGLDFLLVYSFAGGTPKLLWSLPIDTVPPTISDGTDTLIDLDRNGRPEAVLAAPQKVWLVDAATGAPLVTLQSSTLPGFPFTRARALEADLDDQPGAELVLAQLESHADQFQGPNVAAFKVDVQTGAWQELWSADTGSYTAVTQGSADIISDLDGDGKDEVVFSYRSPDTTGNAWVTKVFAGETGAILAELSDARFDGAADLDGDGASELFVATTAGLDVYAFDGTALQLRGQEAAVRVVSTIDPTLEKSAPLDKRVAILDRGGLPPLLLVGEAQGSPDPQSEVSTFQSVRGLRLDPGGLTEVASYTPPLGSITGVFHAGAATRPYDQLAIGINTGLVVVMDRALRPTNGLLWLGGQRLGVPLGGDGLHASPLVGADAGGPFIVQAGSFLGTVVADARFAGWVVPPLPRWWDTGLGAGAIVDLGGAAHVVASNGSEMVARNAQTGASGGAIAMPPGFLWGTPLPLRVGSGERVGVDWSTAGGQITQVGLDFASDSIAWQAAPIARGGFFGSSAADVDGDGTDEWYSHPSLLNRRDAATGALTTFSGHTDMPYSMPVIADFDGGGLDLLLESGWGVVRMLHDDLATVWSIEIPEANNAMSGSRTTCAGAPRFVTPALGSPTLRAYEGSDGSLAAERTYGCGQAFATRQLAEASCARLPVLSNPASAADVGGAGPAVVVGGSDGYLYVADACTLDVRWVANLGASLGDPVIANVDSDADDEILVNAADGFLYGLDSSPFPSPVVSFAQSGPALDMVDPHGSVDVSWDPIAGAEGYEVALVGPEDKAMWEPAFVAVGGTSAVVDVTGALPHRKYRIAVRALGAAGGGTEGFSGDFQVQDLVAPAVASTGTGGLTATLHAHATDAVGLDHVEWSVLAEGAETFVADDLLSGLADDGELLFTAPADLRGAITFVTRAFDAAGLVGSTKLDATVEDDGTIVFATSSFPTPPGGLTPADPEDDPPGTDPVFARATGGCACALEDRAPAPPAGAVALLVAAAALQLRSRRRRARLARGALSD